MDVDISTKKYCSYKIEGMILIYGQIVYYDPYKWDTDGDGLSDILFTWLDELAVKYEKQCYCLCRHCRRHILCQYTFVSLLTFHWIRISYLGFSAAVYHFLPAALLSNRTVVSPILWFVTVCTWIFIPWASHSKLSPSSGTRPMISHKKPL